MRCPFCHTLVISTLTVRKCWTHVMCRWQINACRMNTNTQAKLWFSHFQGMCKGCIRGHTPFTWTALMAPCARHRIGGGSVWRCVVSHPLHLYLPLRVVWVFSTTCHSQPVHKHFYPTGSPSGLRLWYFLLATSVSYTGLPIFYPQTAHIHLQG